MNIDFWKMHGAGNDFILIDDREGGFPADDPQLIAEMARRRTGIGSEGLILIQRSGEADLRMRFFNPDGGEVEMCGNGARCFARLAFDLGAAPRAMEFETVAGRLGAEVLEDGSVRLRMTEPSGWVLDGRLEVEGEELRYDFVNTGVPHVVLTVEDLDDVDLEGTGAAVRYHPQFAPAGTNVNFMQGCDGNTLCVRTYERGVEGESGACGTGIVACGLTAARHGLTSLPVTVRAGSGDLLEVDRREENECGPRVTLTGPAVYVYRGRWRPSPRQNKHF
ncbi:diaminopimelate epimerase [Kiritimatiella glycovorans]|uniref:Diaminopimelate epimerase n=1 Tax=Kiritimatiella glycovorans TaxID=1307763 RepID=A0A0G3EC65_9BACT|nr:diaminopimelate epimerase [Kiritimatiella glycovorans]AKJ64096.1 Diaminopimelate epimerase [Kiritimatiella glycovorans]